MALFKSSEEFYAAIGGLLERVREDRELYEALADSGLVFRFRHFDPEATITLDGRPGVNAIRYGEDDVPASGELQMSCDKAHAFWMGRLNIVAEVLSGRIAYRGSLSKLQRLLPLVKPARRHYPGHLRAIGMEHLLSDSD